MYYAGVAFDQFVGAADDRASPRTCWRRTSPTARSPAFYLDNGFPQDRVEQPPFIDPAFQLAARHRGGSRRPDAAALPELVASTYQRQLTENMMLDVSYIGNRGSRLNHHCQTRGVDDNMNDPRCCRWAPASCSPTSTRLSRGPPASPSLPGFNGTVAQALRKYPQYQAIQWRGVPTGREPVPRHRGRARAALLARAPVPVRLHVLQAEEQRRGERARRRGDQRRRPESRRTRSTGSSAGTTRRTCSSPASPGTSRRRPDSWTRWSEGAARRLEHQRRSSATRAGGR